jgi:NAD(P)-dependent dehydrogenase (short-subunit alcohol dehydrogenase family)
VAVAVEIGGDTAVAANLEPGGGPGGDVDELAVVVAVQLAGDDRGRGLRSTGGRAMTTAIVTGAGGGLGRAMARRLAADGFEVAVVDVADADAAVTCAEIERQGGVARAYVVDLRDVGAIDDMVTRVHADLGPVGALVNNAAVFPSGPFDDVSVDEYDDAIAINQRAYFFVAQAVVRSMRAEGRGGAIVNIGSVTENGGWSDMVAYVVTKGAASALTRAMATELGPYDIRVNCVAPGAFPTRGEEMHADREAYTKRILESQALKRRGTVDELAAAVSFFVGPDSSFVTGQTLLVDGGWVMR